MKEDLDKLFVENAFIDSIPALIKKYNDDIILNDVPKERQTLKDFLKDMKDIGVIDDVNYKPDKELFKKGMEYMKVLLFAHALKIALLSNDNAIDDDTLERIYCSFQIMIMATKNVIKIIEYLETGEWSEDLDNE